MKVFDLLLYVVLLGLFLLLVHAAGTRDANAPPPAPEAAETAGAALAPPSRFDEQVLIQASSPKDGVGTAFAIHTDGYWLTARHVVDGCKDVGLFVQTGVYVPAEEIILDSEFDLALIRTDGAPGPVKLNLDDDLQVGSDGFHVGFPKGKPGEAFTRLHSRSNLVTSGRRKARESVLTWAELGRTEGVNGSLGGISGGPVFNSTGEVRGVILAESPRQGRIYSAAPSAIREFLAEQNVVFETPDVRGFSKGNYGEDADRVRRAGQVVKVACRVTE